jgi:hypothetical protein
MVLKHLTGDRGSWFFGAIIFLIGFAALLTISLSQWFEYVVSISFLLAGLLIMPFFSKLVKRYLNIEITKTHKVLIGFIPFILFMAWAISAEAENAATFHIVDAVADDEVFWIEFELLRSIELDNFEVFRVEIFDDDAIIFDSNFTYDEFIQMKVLDSEKKDNYILSIPFSMIVASKYNKNKFRLTLETKEFPLIETPLLPIVGLPKIDAERFIL